MVHDVPFVRFGRKRAAKITLNDVARAAGVSATSVSYILNGRGAQMRISPETEERVRTAAASLGYRPNRSARNLRTRRTATVGLISDRVAGQQYGSSMLTGATQAARELDHLVVMGESGGDPELERLLIEEMLDRDVDGVVFATRTASRITLPPGLRGVRSVLLNCEASEDGVAAVLPDDVQGGRAAAGALLAAGVRDVWVVGEDPTPESTAGTRRLAGIRQALDEQGLSLSGEVGCAWTVEGAYAACTAWLDSGARPEGLVCLNDRVAMGVYQALGEAGLDVPGDVSVASFDGSDLADWLRPALTSVVLPFPELGALAVRRLLDPADPGGTTLLPLAVRHGASVRPR